MNPSPEMLKVCAEHRCAAHLAPRQKISPDRCRHSCPLWHSCLRLPDQPVIAAFSGSYAFLSNFFPIPGGLQMDGQSYPTLEHAFQASKTPSLIWRERIRRAPTPAEARRVGRKVPIRKDWEQVKVRVMAELLRRKFDPQAHPDLVRQLRATGEALLIEGNLWGDLFWGVDERTGLGLNHLGRLLMEVRQALN
jgi:ribA/ribD-fused uncharacterized protein